MTQDRFGIVGKIIARTYEIRDVVAEGGFGVVYRAYHQGFRAEVALKCLKIPSELTDEQRKSFLEQFRSEAEVLFRLSGHNSHIVRPLHVDAFQTKEEKLVPFMALEWLEGRTLDGLIVQRAENGRSPLSLTKLVRLLTPVAEALEQAHNLPGKDGPEIVVHRDMKPENLFIARVGNEDVAKILDFGISKVKSTAGQMAGRASMKADALVSFSPAYGAPEQWAPRRFGQTGRWTDVWGLALTVVEAAKGDEVVVGDHAAMMGTILDPSRRPTPRNEGVEVSDAVERTFAKAMAVDPVERYQSVGAFWDDLTLALGVQREVGLVSIHHTRQRQGSRATTDTGLDSIRPAPSVDPVSVAAGGGPGGYSGGPTQPGAIPPQSAAPSFSGGGVQSGPAGVSHGYGGGPGMHQAPSAPPGMNYSSPGSGGGPVLGGTPPGSAGYRSPGSHSGPALNQQSSGMQLQAHSRPAPARRYSTMAPSGPSLWKQLSPALALIGLSVAFTILDRAFAHRNGVPLAFGPVKASWVAGGLMIIALFTGVMALKRAMDD